MFILSLFLGLAFVGCDQGIEETKKNNGQQNNNSEIEGGENGNVVARYEFETYENYLAFYNEFSEYNTERYFMPKIEKTELFDSIQYIFESEGVPYTIATNQVFSFCFPFQTMTFKFFKEDTSVVGENKSVLITGKVFDISEYNFEKPIVGISLIDIEKRNFQVTANDIIIGEYQVSVSGFDRDIYEQSIEQAFKKGEI